MASTTSKGTAKGKRARTSRTSDSDSDESRTSTPSRPQPSPSKKRQIAQASRPSTLTYALPIAPNSVSRLPDRPSEGFNGSTSLFSVNRNCITILASDGDSERVPETGERIDKNGNSFYYERVIARTATEAYTVTVDEEGNTTTTRKRDPDQMWRRKIGRLVAVVMFGRRKKEKQPVWELAKWPEGYTLWVANKVRPDSEGSGERRDAYLYGCPSCTFASPHEFVYHAMWLMTGQPRKKDGRPDCECKWCSRRKQQPITDKLLDIVKACDGNGYIGELGKGEYGDGEDEEDSQVDSEDDDDRSSIDSFIAADNEVDGDDGDSTEENTEDTSEDEWNDPDILDLDY